MKENYWIGELFRFWVAACGVKGSFVHKCIWLPFTHENDIFCYCIFCPKSSIGRNYCLENMKQGEVRKLFTCIKLSSICIRMTMMGWPVQKVWGLIPLGGSEFFSCPTLTKETSRSKTCLVWLVWLFWNILVIFLPLREMHNMEKISVFLTGQLIWIRATLKISSFTSPGLLIYY